MKSNEAQPALLVIFGITGDLAKRKLLPALYHLTRDNLLHPNTQIIGVTRQKITKNDILTTLDAFVASHARPSPAASRRFRESFHLFSMDLASLDGYETLKSHLDALERQSDQPYKRLYYLSVPPAVFDEVVGFMGQARLQDSRDHDAPPVLLVEKPFGYDLASARKLIRSVRAYFAESQVYRIDHYLAKETAQNILDFRFSNNLFERIWNHDHIIKVDITAHEKIGIEGRAQFYEQTGALRDLIQSHLLQLMSLVAMERPKSMTAPFIRKQRLKLLNNIRTLKPYEVINHTKRGQYDSYRKEVDKPHSQTETYAQVQLYINNERWENVPFLLRAGKATHEKSTKIEVHFGDDKRRNILTFRLQPNEGIDLGLRVKEPGHDHTGTEDYLDFSYSRSFKGMVHPEAYERVLLDAIRGDQTLFASSKEVIVAWKIIEPILAEWQKHELDLKHYAFGAPNPLGN